MRLFIKAKALLQNCRSRLDAFRTGNLRPIITAQGKDRRRGSVSPMTSGPNRRGIASIGGNQYLFASRGRTFRQGSIDILTFRSRAQTARNNRKHEIGILSGIEDSSILWRALVRCAGGGASARSFRLRAHLGSGAWLHLPTSSR